MTDITPDQMAGTPAAQTDETKPFADFADRSGGYFAQTFLAIH